MLSKVHATAAQVSDAFGSWAVLGDLHRQAPEGGVSRQSCQFMFFFVALFNVVFGPAMFTHVLSLNLSSSRITVMDMGAL